MRPTTIKRHAQIRKAFTQLLGTMPVMKIYVRLADQFNLSDETIRRILRKKRPP